MSKYNKKLKLGMSFNEAIYRYSKVNTKDLAENIVQGKPSPFVKWVGGKRSIMNELLKYVPVKFNNYYEPFIGGGALFFELYNQGKIKNKAVLSDLNWDLIITYKVIQKIPRELIKHLKTHKQNHSKEYYYKMRAKHHLQDPVEIASRFIYLNKTCYNGLWRVNRKDEFNVPMGTYVNPNICDENNIMLVSKALKNVEIKWQSYQDIKPSENDFVYFDPPYHPIKNDSFTAYTGLGFDEKDQKALRNFVVKLKKNKVNTILSNSYCDLIKNLYAKFNLIEVRCSRVVNCKSQGREQEKELMIL